MKPTASAESTPFAIATATDAAMEELAIGLCQSLGPAARELTVIDIGMTPAARHWFAGQGVRVIVPPAPAVAPRAHDRAYFAAMYLRPRLPRMLGAGMVLWIDADCWVQDGAAIDEFRRAALAAPAGVAACAMIDPDYDACIANLVGDQDWYRGLYRELFGEQVAAFMYGRAVLSSGVFCARADAPFWAAWDAHVRHVYDVLRPAGDLGHMAEQCAFNRVLHEAGGFALLRSEDNFHCHGATMERRGSRVVVERSGRAPRIVHLSDFRGMEQRYRAQGLLFDPAAAPTAEATSPFQAALLDEVAALRGARSRLEAQVDTLQGMMAARDAALAAAQAARAQQDAAMAALRVADAAQQADLTALRASLSWRVTAPLRVLRGAIAATAGRWPRALPLLRNRLAWRR
ncbi:hypothetical protein [Roseomonas fluvialis]|uniref:Uncharacterized protein n=1 Tax=Roseomonas fluvialis TaxID=1750527 RepID=A0ABM7Y4J2_9PROT|nr:hypothetical protein [Roseomonas fluvialis]BDG72771.1 hypothetical protein Rmf_27000 [Roseomonas fluvialis]